ncbi:hypothetical protein Taro_047604 [Colocasia esculenta]|uniref:Uncharacterized protein n=1 Tax=Colocasia esculenta TaxID=4460 RepID=A0A843WWJ4_COLES|nr:hypothetical protein [Colocasia esculenta]
MPFLGRQKPSFQGLKVWFQPTTHGFLPSHFLDHVAHLWGRVLESAYHDDWMSQSSRLESSSQHRKCGHPKIADIVTPDGILSPPSEEELSIPFRPEQRFARNDLVHNDLPIAS